jgi:dihydrofolate reductase
MPLHDWVFNNHEVDEAVLADATQRSGAVVMGRNLFDVVDAPGGWSDEIGYGAHNVGRPPFFVVTHQPPPRVRLNLEFTFVAEGVASALDAAHAVCPPDKDVVIMGGGDVIAQAFDQGLVDELILHVSPIVMGAGTPLWAGVARRQLRQTEVRVSPYATHITYALTDRDTKAG